MGWLWCHRLQTNQLLLLNMRGFLKYAEKSLNMLQCRWIWSSTRKINSNLAACLWKESTDRWAYYGYCLEVLKGKRQYEWSRAAFLTPEYRVYKQAGDLIRCVIEWVQEAALVLLTPTLNRHTDKLPVLLMRGFWTERVLQIHACKHRWDSESLSFVWFLFSVFQLHNIKNI